MKKVGNHNPFSGAFVSLVILFLVSFTVIAQDMPAVSAPPAAAATGAGVGDPAAGKTLFNTHCAACHKLDAKATGPALRGVTDRREVAWLRKWIKNSGALIASGDAYAVKIFEEYNKSVMTPFPQLSDTDIDNILAYTSQPKEQAASATGTAMPPGATPLAEQESALSNDVILVALTFVLLVLIVMLVLVNRVLRRIAVANGIDVTREKVEKVSIWTAFVKNQFLVLVSTIFLLLISGYYVYGYLMQIGIDQNYEPIQPIHYSHKIHAGANAIDCKFCHSSARVSKNAGIPSLNICMNCHKNISEVAESTATPEYTKAFYDGEIQKLYDAVGWNKAEQKYTGKTKPVKWVRIHNLPDHAYFNHAQHVTVAGVECQTCHGPVQEYEVMKQFAPLTMGWCINCHRKTDVKMEGNAYYTKIHEELSKKYGVEKLTAAQMGGLECGKCHY